MTTGPCIIQASTVLDLFPTFPEDLNCFIEASNPIFAGYYQDQPACIAGLVPQRESGTALLWGWTTPLIDLHPLIHARWGRRLVKRINTLYPVIIGYCSPAKRHWIELLGGTISPGPDGFLSFRIEAPL